MQTATHLLSEFPIRHYRLTGEGSHANWDGTGPLPPSPAKGLDTPPAELFIQGRPEAFELLDRLPENGFAVVGTRRPQSRSLMQVRTQLRALQGTKLIILSGLALGIDAAAHEEALRAHIPTIAILAGPLDAIYPSENRGLALDILHAGGLLVSERKFGTPLEPYYFLQRNRLIAGWSMATWIVEAGFRSGALNTAMWARNQNRDTYSTPCYPGDVLLAGNERLLSEDRAYGYWSPRSLEHTWKELLTHRNRQKRSAQLPLFNHYNDGSDAGILAEEVRRLGIASGGARVEEILEWTLGLGWDPQRFFSALQCGLNELRIEDRSGLLTAP